MKKLALLLMIVPLFWQCTTGPSKTELRQMNDSLLMATAQKEIQMNQLVGTLADIEENLRLIKEKEQIISLQAESGDVRGRAGEQINQDIQLIYDMMVQNKNRIQELEQQMKKTGVDNQRLNRLITGLNEQLRERTEEVVRLQELLAQRDLQIGQLNTEIRGLSDEMDAIRKEQDATRRQLDSTTDLYNTAWFAIGTRRELRDQKILTRDGFLFFGSSRVLKEDFDNQYFNKIDIREKDQFPLYNKKAEVMTAHPAGSYQLVKEEDGNITLVITDINLFWSISRYLVVKVG